MTKALVKWLPFKGATLRAQAIYVGGHHFVRCGETFRCSRCGMSRQRVSLYGHFPQCQPNDPS